MKARCGTALALLLLAAPGCASVFRAPATIERTEGEVQAIRTEQAALRQKIEEMQASQTDLAGLVRENNADAQTRLAEISEALATLQAQLEEVTRRSARPAEYRPAPPADTTATAGAPPAGEAPDPNRLYEAGYLDVTRGNYAAAIEEFGLYLRYFPNTELSDNARYWIGESYYAQKDYVGAAREFQGLIDAYPKGDKIPAALLKLGYSQQGQGEEKRARATFEKVIKEFPQSEEARLARQRIEGDVPGGR
jgi:tol-pal system protein YbgF